MHNRKLLFLVRLRTFRQSFIVFFIANVGFEPQRTLNYKAIVDEAIKVSGIGDGSVKCIIFNRSEGKQADLMTGRDRDWSDLMASARDLSDCEPIDANHPLYLLYTSGTTGTPKAIVRPTAGYAVMLQWTMKYLYNVHPGEVWWSAADLGWVNILKNNNSIEFFFLFDRSLVILMDAMVHC